MKGYFINKNKNLHFYIVTLLGLGGLSKAPGTLGSLAALPSIFYLSFYGLTTQIFFIFFLFLVALIFIKKYLVFKGRVNQDPKEVIIDEFLGMHIAFVGLKFSIGLYCIAFVLFRFFDILKPFPISYIDKNVKGAFGVLLDDIIAGIVVLVILQFVVIRWFF